VKVGVTVWMSVRVNPSIWFPIGFFSLRVIGLLVFILNERICKGCRDIDDFVSRLELPNIFI